MPGVGVEELKTEKFWFAVLAEFMGTLLLILVACGSCNQYHRELPVPEILPPDPPTVGVAPGVPTTQPPITLPTVQWTRPQFRTMKKPIIRVPQDHPRPANTNPPIPPDFKQIHPRISPSAEPATTPRNAFQTLPSQATTIRVSLAFGFSVATIVWMIAHCSGGHINPAITVAFVVTRKISILRYVLTCRRDSRVD